jgi:hypothetical protein
MDVEVEVTGHGPGSDKSLIHFTVTVRFGGPIETMMMTVVIPARADEDDAGRARAIARAKELTRLFVTTA